ncbi:MAG: thioesterase domain-containing protein [Chitinophagaceae bacterium]
MTTVTLLVLPFAGGNQSSYKKFSEAIPTNIKIKAIELPGRGSRYKEKLLTSLDDMVDDIYEQIGERLISPYAIYGHSMGALLGYLFIKKVIEKNILPPVHFFVTGRGGPSYRYKSYDLYKLPSDHFIQCVELYGGFPRGVTNVRKWLPIFEPVLRADFQAVENYQYKETFPFDVPITAGIGIDDTITTKQAESWKKETTSVFELVKFPGDHFFIFTELKKLLNIIDSKLLLTTS